MSRASVSTRRVVVAGGGPAALEGALRLHRLAAGRVVITLVAPDTEFAYRPLGVIEPFGHGTVPTFDLRDVAAEHGWHFEQARVAAVDAGGGAVTADDGRKLPYDELLLAVGAGTAEAIPGALTFRGGEDAPALAAGLDALPEERRARVAVLVPASVAWTLPAYELALLAARWGRDHDRDLEVWLITREGRPLSVFGADAAAEVHDRLEGAGVQVWDSAEVEAVENDRVWVTMEGAMPVDLAVALPRPVARRIAGLPRDELGFVPTDENGRVSGSEHVFAAGDMTAYTLKQGGLATQQADAAAAAIAVQAGAEVPLEPYRPVLHGMLLTGEQTAWLLRAPGHPGAVTADPPWWPPHKIVGRELAPYLAARASTA